jgi:hypothetical protein
MVQFLLARSGSEALDSALQKLSDSISAPSATFSVELARVLRDQGGPVIAVVLRAIGPLGLDRAPFIALVGDYRLSPETRWRVFRAIRNAPPNDLMADAVLSSLCQISAWVAGASLQEGVRDPLDRLNVAVSEDVGRFYLDMLRFVHRHEEVVGGRTTCASLPDCLGAAAWVWEELARP